MFGAKVNKLISKTKFTAKGNGGTFDITFNDTEVASLVRILTGGDSGRRGKLVSVEVDNDTKSEKLMSLLQIAGANK